MQKNTHHGKKAFLGIGEPAQTQTSSNNKPALAIELDGEELPDIKSLYKKLSLAFSFPSYFGNNLDALDEMLHDLSWLSDKRVNVVLLHYSSLLNTEKTELKKLVTSMLIDSSLEAFLSLQIESEPEIRRLLEEREIAFYEIPG